MQLSTYLKIYPCSDRPGMNLLYSTLRSSVALVADDLLEAAVRGGLNGQERETLARLGMLTPDREAEQERMRTIFRTPRPGTPFSAVVLLNLDCNLACSYCYEQPFRGKSYMSLATAGRLVEMVRRERIERGQPVRLTFYGGEPLLSPDLIRAISAPLRGAARAAGVGFGFSLVTNGTLLGRDLVEELLPLGLGGAKVTLDGPEELHDASRPYARGGGSYRAILANLRQICHILPLQLGGNYTRRNYAEFPRLLDDLLAAGIDPARIASVLFSPVVPRAGERMVPDFTPGCATSHEPWLVEASLFLREETLRRGFAAPRVRLSSCMVEREDELVINYDGSFYKCPAFLAYPELRVGSLEGGIGDYRQSHDLEAWHNRECLQCPYLPLCFGGCRQLLLLRAGEIGGVDCRREYYDAVLEAVVRQDLRYGGARSGT